MNEISLTSLYDIYRTCGGVSTDTRQIKENDLFFALKGPNFNGNLFAKQALETGAAYAIVDEVSHANGKNILYSRDALKTLQELALFHRQQLTIPVIAITGSNGKTTTKELVHAVLSTTYKTYTTVGNLNNHIGIPLTLLKIRPDAELAVVEMGANHRNEIAGYCAYTLPTHGLITNAGKAHLEGFGGVEGVRKGKGELFDYLRENQGIAFACADFDYLEPMAKGIPEVIWYGTSLGEIRGEVVESSPFLRLAITHGFDRPVTLNTNLVGDYNSYNVLAACMIGKHFNVPDEASRSAIEGYIPSNLRSQLLEKDGNTIILDAYNANPSSMNAAIKNFALSPSKNKMLFLGAMAELGDESLAEHKALVDLINQYEWKKVILVGGDFAHIKHDYAYFPNAEEAADWWQDQNDAGNYILIKGSRSIGMEQIVQ